MADRPERMLDKTTIPTETSLADWLGSEAYGYWRAMQETIEDTHPGVFSPEWLYGGKQYGWYLRYKKSRAYCSLIPEQGRGKLVIVLGAKERAEAEDILPTLTPAVAEAVRTARTFHDGTWVALTIDSAETIDDTFRLLALKRRPKKIGNKG